MGQAYLPSLYVVHESPIVLHFLEVTLGAHGHMCLSYATLDEFLSALPPLATGCLVMEAQRLDERRTPLIRALRDRGARLAVLALTDDISREQVADIRSPSNPAVRENVVSPNRIVEAVSDAMAWVRSGYTPLPSSGGVH